MKRYALPDLLKGFAVFLIVPVHILETFIDYPGRESLFGKTLLFLGRPVVVSVFMIIMGYFEAQSKKSSRQTLIRGLMIFALGFLLNIGLNFHLLWKIKFEGLLINPWEYIWGVDIFYLAGLSLIFLSFLKLLKNRSEWILIFLIIGITVLTSTMNNLMMSSERNYILPFIAGKYSWSYFPLFPWLAYPLIGFLFHKTENRIFNFIRNKKYLTISGSVVVFFLVLIFSKQGFEKTINLNEYYHHTFLYFLWALGIIILWGMLIKRIVQKFENNPAVMFFRWLGKNITVFYIIQWLIIGNIATAIYQTKSLSEYPLWFAGIFLVTISLTYGVEIIKKMGLLKKNINK